MPRASSSRLSTSPRKGRVISKVCRQDLIWLRSAPWRAETECQPRSYALTVLAFVLPIALYFWLISADAIDGLRADQWYDIRLIQHSFTGTLRFGMLWSQHGDNRIFFQNIITLILGHVIHYNVIVEEYISAVLLIAATTLVILTHHRRAPKTHWIAYSPVAILLLSVAQFGDTLYGFQIGWYLIMLALSIALFFLDRPVLTRIAFSVAVAAAIVGSFSSLQGLFIWPVGLVLLLQRARSRSFVLSWIAAGVASAVLYFHDWSGGESGGISYPLRHPVEAAKFLFFAVGDVVSIQIPNSPHGAQYGVFVLGIAIVGTAVWLLVAFGFRVDESSARPVGVALIWFGLLFAVAIADGRTSFGLSDTSTSRYVTFDLLILVGSYLVVLDRYDAVGLETHSPYPLVARNHGCRRRTDMPSGHFRYGQWDFRCPSISQLRSDECHSARQHPAGSRRPRCRPRCRIRIS